ncbi:PucR family transcriptional regulator [Sediminibacillus halophilus]|uniref:PucR C-terminal helix-turn-helix domain-containing protein n=1 Tax=Sediminibacillus halophilus TaxID=482461 RepID=A0A1G9PQL6_9BACI|nr:helix-turn-helix domain-containing protein [Sediminibacillus halophilus]SDM01132.1 PucR C-terminal helix-turn-helix domain-containing protein [Sediminibacillus halophilus]
MINKLRAVFPGLIEYHPEKQPDIDAYRWFTTDKNEIVGIPEKELSEKDLLLLGAFLQPYHFHQAPMNQQELAWTELLFRGTQPDLLSEIKGETYRFIYFHLSEADTEPASFREAIASFYPEFVPIVWISANQGIIVEQGREPDDGEISYGQITDLLMSDFYMKVHLFIGPSFSDLAQARKHFQKGAEWFETIRKYNKGSVVSFIDAVPYLFLSQSSVRNKEIVSAVFQDTLEEKELLATIQTFLECNSNATMAAKKLYMHRNSLQYRVDKFIEKTGIDVKQFKGALTVYLALMINQIR